MDGHTGTQGREVRGSPAPRDHSGGSHTDSSQCTRCRSGGRKGVSAEKEAEPPHRICTKWKERPLKPEVWEWTVIRHQTEEKLGRPSFQAKQKIVQNGKCALHG